MVPGYVQGGTRPPPDHPQGGPGGELYSEGLWKTLNNQHPTSDIEPGKAGQASLKPPQCALKATTKRVDSQLIGTPMRPQSHPKATLKLPQCYPKAPTKPALRSEERRVPIQRNLLW